MILSELRAQGWKYGCLTALVLALGGWAAAGVQSYRLQVSKGAVALLARDAALAGMLAAEAARNEEHARGDLIATADRNYQRGLQDGKAAADRLLADRDTGAVVLRDKFRCPSRGVSGPASGPSVGDGSEGAILSVADQDFLVRVAEEADRNTRQLAACQAVIEADRAEVAP